MWRFLLLSLGLAALSLSSAATVTVKPGDTLYGLARKQGVSLETFLAANKGVNPQLALKVGQVLQLPARSGTSRPATTAGGATIRPAGIRVTAVLPVQGRLTSPYSPAHLGLDLAALTGTVILAARAGRVTESRYDARTGWGWTILLDHGDGMETRYSHNSANLVQVGQVVETGQVIGRVGSTGNSTGPHLDFRVMVEGKVVNPMGVVLRCPEEEDAWPSPLQPFLRC
jgi:murein DD-endopeptidase MepM/ murein hydrolase activator NlpD